MSSERIRSGGVEGKSRRYMAKAGALLGQSAGNFAREKAETYNHAGTELRNLIGDGWKRCGVSER